MVQMMAAMKMSQREMCCVIGDTHRGSNGKPISEMTLQKHFKYELANGGAVMRATIGSKLRAALDANEPWAIQMCLRNRFGWVGRDGSTILELEGDKPERTIVVSFHTPQPQQLEPPKIVDVTPREPSPPPKPYVEGRALPPPARDGEPYSWMK
jgi:hypothetical protein